MFSGGIGRRTLPISPYSLSIDNYNEKKELPNFVRLRSGRNKIEIL